MFYTDNPILDAERYADEQEKWLQKLPVCCKCKERIQDDTCFDIHDEIICEECMEQFRKYTEDFMR